MTAAEMTFGDLSLCILVILLCIAACRHHTKEGLRVFEQSSYPFIYVILRQDGDSALTYAANEGQAASVQLLLDAGADKETADNVRDRDFVGFDAILAYGRSDPRRAHKQTVLFAAFLFSRLRLICVCSLLIRSSSNNIYLLLER